MKVKLILEVMKRNILLISVIVGVVVWSCTKNDSMVPSQPRDLKQSIDQNVAAINTAMTKISSTNGYKILVSGSSVTGKALDASSFRDSITLALVAGIYDYQPDTLMHHHYFAFPYRLFKKSGSSDKMIVNLPQKLIFHPGYMHNYNPKDSVLKNDFKITTNNYHYYFNSWNSLDYLISAGLALNNADLGNFKVSTVATSTTGRTNSSDYNFTGGYSVSTAWQSGDTTKMSFALSKDNNQMLKETTLFTGYGFHKREKQYDLIIGNVEIKRGFGIDSIQVFVNGTLQKKAGAKITDSADSTGTICGKRDILLTYDDGTTAKLSSLIGPQLTQLKTLISSLHDMYFAENVVDYIAISIYLNSR